MKDLPFDQRACFIAGQAKSGTTLLVALLDNHPELLVLPEETAYFPTVLTKYGPRGRRAQFDYITKESLSNVLFGGPCKWGKRDYSYFPTARFLQTFEQMAFDPLNAERDLLVILLEAYAAILGRSLGSITRWVEKTPANRKYLPAIHTRFPHARVLVTMRDPRAIFAAQIALEKTRQLGTFSTYYCISHWRDVAKVVLRARDCSDTTLFDVPYEKLILEPAKWMKQICAFLEIEYDPAIVLTPTKAGKFWEGNSATETAFFRISTEPLTRWQSDLSEEEIGWVEWHCRDLMPEFGYEPRLGERSLRHFMKPTRYERPRQYLKSRFYSLRDDWIRR
ncbi:MAG TPA: sulfotransferase [Candidatus Baltobacteraceae bacterium]|nr:sulfotransferase [Candidatus Baltobacteraceae bacterium]